MNQAIDNAAILPELIMAGTIVLVLIADAFLAPKRKWLRCGSRSSASSPR